MSTEDDQKALPFHSGAPAPRGQRGLLPPALWVRGTRGQRNVFFLPLFSTVLKVCLSVRTALHFTLAHLEGYCLAPADIQLRCLHQRGSKGCPCCYWAGAEKCPALPLPTTILNASFSRRLVTRSCSFKTVLPCPFRYIVHGRLHHYKGSCMGAEKCPALPSLCTIPFLMQGVQEGSSLTLVLFERYCLTPSDSPHFTVACPTGPRGRLPLLLLDGAEKCSAFLFFCLINARCSRRMFTYSRSF